MNDRDELAALLRQAEEDPPESGETYQQWAERIADQILARWRLANRYKCAYKASHELADGEQTHCGMPVIPWEDRSVR